MSYRFMRVLVFFDLPVETSEDRRNYRKFHKVLTKKGFVMLQESVYSKIVLNQTGSGLVQEYIRQNKPPRGIVQMLVITEKQYAQMEYVVGEHSSEVVDSDERVLII